MDISVDIEVISLLIDWRTVYCQEFFITPSTVILFPGETSAQFSCQVNPFVLTVSWEVNGTRYGLDELFDGDLPGHNVSGSNITVSSPINSTKYVCLIPAIPPARPILSNPAFLYIAGPPSMIGNIMIDNDTVNIDNSNICFILNWDEPFANFDPIVNYTVTINCNDASCPVMLTVATTSASVNFITDLSMMTPLSVTASNTVGTSDPAIIMIAVPADVDMVYLICAPVNLISQCDVTWNALANHAAIPVTYTVHYFGQNITNGSISVANLMATFDLPAVDSDVNVLVTALNAFGSGPNSNIAMDEIISSSVTDVIATLDSPNENKLLHSITVTCIIQHDNAADLCEVRATTNGETLTGNALITNGMATVTIDGLACGMTYTIIAGGTLDGDLVGPRSSHGTITAGPCPLITVTTTANITSVTVTDVAIRKTPSLESSAIPSQLPPDSNEDNTGVIIGVVVGGVITIILILVPLIIVYYYCKKYKKMRKPGNAPVAMSNIPVYDTVPDPAVSDKVKMESNPAYQVLTSDQANKGPDPAYQDLSSYSGRASASKQKPAGDINYYEDIIKDQNITLTKNPSYAVP